MISPNKQFLKFLGKKIRNGREKMGVSQEQFGKMTKFHRTYVGMIERGEKNITIFNLRRFTEALGVPVKDLVDF